MKRVVVAGVLNRLDPLAGEDATDVTTSTATCAEDGEPRIFWTRHHTGPSAPAEATRTLFSMMAPDELAARPGDIVRFRYGSRDMRVARVVERTGDDLSPWATFADAPGAARLRDLRVVRRAATR